MDYPIRLLITTDNHLGFKESDPIRGNDSFNAFKEVLEIPSKTNIDAILILGDLFHESNTTYSCLNKCMDVMQNNIGRKKHLDDHLDLDIKHEVNLEPHSIPTIIIHGNHDQPLTEYKNGSLDILEKAGYVTYIGKYFNYEDLHIKPFFITKGNIKIAIYAFGYVKDTKLNYLLRNDKVTFGNHNQSDFRILIVHQNRHKGARLGCPAKNCLNLSLLPKHFFDLILWGHEHQSIGQIMESEEFGQKIYQPGSSIPTSLSKAEAVTKSVGILEFDKKAFDLQPIDIKFQRKIFLDEIVLKSFIKDVLHKESQHKSGIHATDAIISSTLDQYKWQSANAPKFTIEDELVNFLVNKHGLKTPMPLLPLARFKIFVEEDESLNSYELQSKMKNYVANKR